MPKANWGVSSSDINNFDREKQYKPYTGPIPPSGAVFQWKVKVLKYFPATQQRNPQLRIGLELVPQRKDEKKYAGFFVMTFRAVTPKTQFNYVPFLDAIGVSANDFINRTNVDQEGNVIRIGGWRNSGDEMVLAQLKDSDDEKGNPRKDIGWIGALEDTNSDDDDDYDDDEYDEEIDEDDYEDNEDDEYEDDEGAF